MDKIMEQQYKLIIKPITLKCANCFIVKYHRHHKESKGAKFSIGIFVNSEIMVGVAICGRPVSRILDNGQTIEVTRVCVIDGIKNGCSKLYSACSRIAKEMGYIKIITYTLKSETGISLKASGWFIEKEDCGGTKWNSSKSIKITNTVSNLFETYLKYPSELKKRWAKILNNTQTK